MLCAAYLTRLEKSPLVNNHCSGFLFCCELGRHTCSSARVFILNLDTRWRVISSTRGALYPPWKNSRYPLNGEVWWAPESIWEEKNAFIPGGYRPPVPRLVQVFSATSDLFFFLMPDSSTSVTPGYLALRMFVADTVHVIEQHTYCPTQNSRKNELSMRRTFVLLNVCDLLLSVPRYMGTWCESLLLDYAAGSWHLCIRYVDVAACWENRTPCVKYYMSVRT